MLQMSYYAIFIIKIIIVRLKYLLLKTLYVFSRRGAKSQFIPEFFATLRLSENILKIKLSLKFRNICKT
jgi:hypothetical protein